MAGGEVLGGAVAGVGDAEGEVAQFSLCLAAGQV